MSADSRKRSDGRHSLGKREFQPTVIPSEVEGSRGATLKLSSRDGKVPASPLRVCVAASTSLGMTGVVPRIKLRGLQRKFRLDLAALQRFGERALQLCGQIPHQPSVLASLPEIGVLLISDCRIASLHRKFMKIEGPTDVITFQHGEIFISVETAARNARRFQTSLHDELRLYIVHGLLHLHGFDDSTPAKSRAMNSVQRRILARSAGLETGFANGGPV